jgi:hypothetical protein
MLKLHSSEPVVKLLKYRRGAQSVLLVVAVKSGKINANGPVSILPRGTDHIMFISRLQRNLARSALLAQFESTLGS